MVPEIYLGARNCETLFLFKPPVWRRNIWEWAKGRSVDARESEANWKHYNVHSPRITRHPAWCINLRGTYFEQTAWIINSKVKIIVKGIVTVLRGRKVPSARFYSKRSFILLTPRQISAHLGDKIKGGKAPLVKEVYTKCWSKILKGTDNRDGIMQQLGNVRITWYWGAFVPPLLPWKSSKYYIFWVCVYSLRYTARNALASYCHLRPV